MLTHNYQKNSYLKLHMFSPSILEIKKRKNDHVISAALRDIQAYDSYFKKFNNFSLTFHFFKPKERDLHGIMLLTKQTHTYTYCKFIQHHNNHNTPARQFHHRYQNNKSKYTSTFFLNFTYCIKDTNIQGILRNYAPINQVYIYCPLTKTFNVDKSRPLIVPHEFLQPVEIQILEFIHNTRYNHKPYNFIQNTPYEF